MFATKGNPIPWGRGKVCQLPDVARAALAAGIESKPVASVLLMPGSLLVFNREAYKDCLHGIDEVCLSKPWSTSNFALPMLLLHEGSHSKRSLCRAC